MCIRDRRRWELKIPRSMTACFADERSMRKCCGCSSALWAHPQSWALQPPLGFVALIVGDACVHPALMTVISVSSAVQRRSSHASFAKWKCIPPAWNFRLLVAQIPHRHCCNNPNASQCCKTLNSQLLKRVIWTEEPCNAIWLRWSCVFIKADLISLFLTGLVSV